MATNFPSSLDTFTNPLSTDTLASPDHAGQHTNINDAVAALEAKVGVNGSAVTTTLDYKVAQRALASEPFVTVGISSGLSGERALTAGAGITITDGGANSTVTVAKTGYPARLKYSGTTYFSLLPGVVINGVTGNNSFTANQDIYEIFYLADRSITIDALVMEIVTAAGTGNLRLGLYALTDDLYPTGAPLFDSGNISCVTGGVKVATISPALTLAPGNYAVVFNKDNTSTSRYFMTSQVPNVVNTTVGGTPFWWGLSQARATAAFLTNPTPTFGFGNSGAIGNTASRVLIRISNPAA